MPPKKKTSDVSTKQSGISSTKQSGEVQTNKGQATEPLDSTTGDDSTKKRKASDSTIAKKEPNKSARRSGRGGPKPSADKLINFLLSDEAIEICTPQDELEDSKSKRTYTTVVPLSPFEELVCALILSRPISHRLGYRTIRTLLNDPYNYTTPKAVKDAGEKKIWQALDFAKTQHKGKTAAQLEALAGTAIEKFADNPKDADLRKLSGLEDENEITKALLSIKGIGQTGVSIFLRRVQAHWSGIYPLVDERSQSALEHLGLPRSGDELAELIKTNWKTIDHKAISAMDDADKQRLAFVRVVELAVAAELESKSQDLLEAVVES